MTEGNCASLSKQTLSYYFERCWVLGPILGSGDHAMRAWLRFAGVLAAWLLIIYAASSYAQAIRLAPTAVGLLEDKVMLGVCLWQLIGVAVLLVMIRVLDSAIVAMPNVMRTGGEAIHASQSAELERLRSILCVRHPGARRIYIGWMLTAFALVILFQIWLPHQDAGARSWAIWPQQFPMLYYAVATPWALFYYPFVFGHFVWFLFATVFYVLPSLARHIRTDRLTISPIREGRANGLESLGTVTLCAMLLASGGLLIAIPWIVQFPTDKPADLWVKGIVALYGLVLFLLYVVPLWIVHRSLLKARRASLNFMAGLFAQNFDRMRGLIGQSDAGLADPRQLFDYAAHLGGFESLFRRIETMSTWPTNPMKTSIASIVSGSPFVTAIGSWDRTSQIYQIGKLVLRGAGIAGD